MDSWEHKVLRCHTLSMSASEPKSNLQMSTPTLKQETLEKELPCNDLKYLAEPLVSPEYVNYYDSKGFVVEKLKKEFPEDEYSQSDFSINYTIASENKELLKLIDKKGVKYENKEEDNANKQYQFLVKREKRDDQDIMLDNAGATSIHYDVLVTLQEIQCKLCGIIFKNSFNLLKHYNKHIQVVINTPGDNSKMMDLHQCQYFDKCFNFNNHGKMLAHGDDVHSKINSEGKLCGNHIKSAANIKRRVMHLHKQMCPHQVTQNSEQCKYCNADSKCNRLCRSDKGDKKIKYKCDLCVSVFNRKNNLKMHVRRLHYNYVRTFDCWCGNQFQTPKNLLAHMRRKHDSKMKVQCDYCQKYYKSKCSLERYIKSVNYDYGKVFDFCSGKQFQTPLNLCAHIKRKNHDKMTVQCDYCKKFYKYKSSLAGHIKRVHYDYGKVIQCWCGTQFRAPSSLREHMKRQHDGEMKVQCDYCQKFYNSKYYLEEHIKNFHYDYGKVFECWCGKQFRTPRILNQHKRREHGGKNNGTNNDKLYSSNNGKKLCYPSKEDEQMKYKCDSCDGSYKSKDSLALHKKSTHYDYGKTFECWCGKQFRTPIHLRVHMRRQHNDKMKFQCDHCQQFYKYKNNLVKHIKMIHCDYGKVFACWCGKQFRTPIHLYTHVRRQHDGKIKDKNKDKPQSASCSTTS